MAKYILSCCSTADLSKEHFDKIGVKYICFHYELDGVEHPDDLGQTMPFEEFYRQNFKTVYGFLINLCKSSDLAEELTAETFLKAFEHYKSYNKKYKPSTWLCAIAKNEYLKYLRKQKKIDSFDNTEIADISNLEEKLSDKDTALRIHKYLHILDEPYREVFILKVFAELSYKEIAEIFDKKETWVRVTYYRAKVRLLERLGDDNE